MRKSIFPVIILIVLAFVACNTTSKNEINAEDYSKFQQAGDKISNITQGVLLTNVGKAMKSGGPKNAVSFCNLKVTSIVDSLNSANNCHISRISDKNRNPENAVQNKSDEQIWNFFARSSSGDSPKDTLIASEGEFIYYKPIKIAMEACLKCHGVPEQDIDVETYAVLQKLYPNDLATNYKLNDFRGLWKIRFQDISN